MEDHSKFIVSLLKELDKEAWKQSPNPWTFVANLNGVDVYHKTFDRHIGVLGEAFLPNVDAQQLFSVLN